MITHLKTYILQNSLQYIFRRLTYFKISICSNYVIAKAESYIENLNLFVRSC